WSLGMVLYELLVGSPMYNIDTLPALCAAIIADPPVPLRSQRPDAPPELEAAVLRCTQKDPAQRFASVAEFAQAIAPFTSPEGALLAARAARRLAARGDALQLSRVSVSGTFSGGPRASVPAPAPAVAPASAPASAPPVAPRRWQGVALALGGAALAVVAVTALLIYLRRVPSEERPPLAPPARDDGRPLAPIARDGGSTPLPFAPSGASGPTIEPVAPGASVATAAIANTTAAPAAPAAPATRSASPPPSIVPAPPAVAASVPAAAASSAPPRRPPPPARPKPSSEFDDSALRHRR
ncbi:MAG TPA: hypothetical protein VFS00_20525, partial [Polyangiaceae bacterium]|nr:hypothetical protein [Polyangiaceae bacterium]